MGRRQECQLASLSLVSDTQKCHHGALRTRPHLMMTPFCKTASSGCDNGKNWDIKFPVRELGAEAYSNSNNTVGNSKGRQGVKCQLPSTAAMPATPTKSLPFLSQPPFLHREDKGVGSNRICFAGFTKIQTRCYTHSASLSIVSLQPA